MDGEAAAWPSWLNRVRRSPNDMLNDVSFSSKCPKGYQTLINHDLHYPKSVHKMGALLTAVRHSLGGLVVEDLGTAYREVRAKKQR